MISLSFILGHPVYAGFAEESSRQVLMQYFRAATGSERREIAARVAQLPGVTVESVAAQLHELSLWPPAEPGIRSFDMDMGDGETRAVWIRVPPQYDPDVPWPLLISLHGTGGEAGNNLRFAASFLGRDADRMILAAPQAQLNGPFNIHDESETGQPATVLRELRRRFHVDSNRVFLTGYSKGGHRTCSAAVMFADQWAGVMPLAGTMALPQNDGLYPQFLPNLRHLPMLMVWGELDTKGLNGEESPYGGITGTNRRFVKIAEQMQLPLTAVELPGVGHGGVIPPRPELSELLKARRAAPPTEVSHWFRFPGQGSAYWIRLAEFRGEPWRSGEIHITLKRGDDAEEAFLRETRLRMGKLEGTIEGQTVRVRARRAESLDVLFNGDLVDLSTPILIKLNGRRAFEGVLEPRIETLLDVASSDWDFDRLFPVRVRIRVGKRGVQM